MEKERLLYELTGAETPKFINEREDFLIDKFLIILNEREDRIKELEGTIENNVTEVSEFFNDGVKIFECNSCGMLMEENEPYNNYCPNCGRKIKK